MRSWFYARTSDNMKIAAGIYHLLLMTEGSVSDLLQHNRYRLSLPQCAALKRGSPMQRCPRCISVLSTWLDFGNSGRTFQLIWLENGQNPDERAGQMGEEEPAVCPSLLDIYVNLSSV
ncbi:hypothetical protein KCP73_17860 [Salmonella enterica subsp. enterica]|nr:hypothetical protein KCP73_17860 [Salmonella enterica subsp. enterica]